ncbi:hypothetical protein SAMN05428988_1186 [Chitinophaga sp. YR573]|uniref:hypothetical protein n=1 Tax=Chitinophaga sp. YR573 TaxID=1881040 RepID=UPI0008B55366|nr:hypothetical protein [Chitinophaga sp. YR573]SEW00582.1 hypothetical protein SAMN05428988_1186 [Chitinophaga sp. YR573]
MNREITFPENLSDFLYWVKETTESYWSKVPHDKLIHGAKWLPLTDQQIDELELKYTIKFGVEHRTFLRILHTIDKHYEEEEEEFISEEEGKYEESEEERKRRVFVTPPYRPSFFYNWITEKEWIESRLAWIDDFYVSNILGLSKSWLRSWGPRPESDEEKVRIFREWYQKAPCLLPITAHTFLMDDGGHGLRPVLSVYGFDTIIMAWSLRHFLMREFDTELGLTEIYYDDKEDYPQGYIDLVKGIPELDALQTIRLDDTDIPYWKEVLTYYHYPNHNCWQGFWVPWSKPKL